jgi:hypothetical protein
MWKGLSVITDSPSPIVVVLSGSMEPAFQRGDLLLLWNRNIFSETNVGEIVVYNVKGKDIPIVHRVVRKFGVGWVTLRWARVFLQARLTTAWAGRMRSCLRKGTTTRRMTRSSTRRDRTIWIGKILSGKDDVARCELVICYQIVANVGTGA